VSYIDNYDDYNDQIVIIKGYLIPFVVIVRQAHHERD